MKPFHASLAMALLLPLTVASAGAGSDAIGAFPAPRTASSASGARKQLLARATPRRLARFKTPLFEAGGTVVENPRSPPGGVPNVAGVPGIYQRGQALGTWSYDPAGRKYFVHLQFDNFVDNVYHGYSTVDREIVLSKHGLLASAVRSARFTADHQLMIEVCGEAISARL